MNQNSKSVSNSHRFISPKAKQFQEFFFHSQRIFQTREQITQNDLENFHKLGFSGPLIALKKIGSDNQEDLASFWNITQNSPKESFQLFWNQIHTFIQKIAPNWSFSRILEYFLEIKSVNQLSRQEFYDYHTLLGFLKGPEGFDFLHKMKSFMEILKFSNTETLCNSKLESLVDCIQITSEVILIDLKGQSESFVKDSIIKLIDKPLGDLAKGKGGFKIGILKSVIIHEYHFSRNTSNSIFKILKQNADFLDHLELICTTFDSPSESYYPIRFSHLSTLRIHNGIGKIHNFNAYFEFSAHFNYKVLDISNNIYFGGRDTDEYFVFIPNLFYVDSFEVFIRRNPYLKCVFFDNLDNTRTNRVMALGFEEILRPLEKLENLFIFNSDENKFNFVEPLNLKTLFIRGMKSKFNWSVLEKLPNLEYLNVMGGISKREEFIEFISKSNIKTLNLNLSGGVFDLKAEFFQSLNDCKNLQNLALDPNLIKHFELKKVNNLKFSSLFLKNTWKPFQYFPMMQNVKFVYFNCFDTSNIEILKAKLIELFPHLEALYFEEGIFSEDLDFGFEIIQSRESLVRKHFMELGCLTIEEIEYNPNYWFQE